jgi:ubiquinone/menaquinone biosynthesis C-methylase UbiE
MFDIQYSERTLALPMGELHKAWEFSICWPNSHAGHGVSRFATMDDGILGWIVVFFRNMHGGSTMPWFSWFRRRKKSASAATATAAAEPPPLYTPGRATVMAGESHYVLPNDLHEANRLDLQQLAMREYFGTNTFAPVIAPQRVLDVACGTGRWAMDVARQFPQAQVLGVDIAVPQPEYLAKAEPPPPNYTFQQGNALEPLPFPDGTFDYVHMRFIFSAMPLDRWPSVVRELVRVTAPGGWIELVEAASPNNGGPALAQFAVWGQQLMGERGVDLSAGQQIGTFLREAGIPNVTTRDDALPMGPHGGRIGQIVGVDMFTAFRSAMKIFVSALGVEQATADATLAQADADVYGAEYHAQLPIYIAYGQKPVK